MNAVFAQIQEMLSEVLNHKIYRIVRCHKIRWMSRINTLARFIRLMKPLLLHYENLQASENHRRYSQLTNYSLLKFIYVLADILEPLRIITEQFQWNKLTITKMKKILDSQKAILCSLKTSKGINEEMFDNLLVRTRATSARRWARSMGEDLP